MHWVRRCNVSSFVFIISPSSFVFTLFYAKGNLGGWGDSRISINYVNSTSLDYVLREIPPSDVNSCQEYSKITFFKINKIFEATYIRNIKFYKSTSNILHLKAFTNNFWQYYSHQVAIEISRPSNMLYYHHYTSFYYRFICHLIYSSGFSLNIT